MKRGRDYTATKTKFVFIFVEMKVIQCDIIKKDVCVMCDLIKSCNKDTWLERNININCAFLNSSRRISIPNLVKIACDSLLLYNY
jgi:hypothetical protein